MSNPALTEWIYRGRIRANLVCILASVALARPTPTALLAGGGFIILGLILRGWAAGHLRKEKELTVSGPYRYTRNPLYVGSLVIGIGAVAACRSWAVLVLFAAYFLIFYPVAVQVEKRRMIGYFPEAYREYSRAVPLFFPALRKPPARTERRFDPALFRRNNEHRALIGAAFFVAALVVRLWFP